jgi:hypothetical protein
MKTRRNPFSSCLHGSQLLIDSFSVCCMPSRDSHPTRACCSSEKGLSWETESAYPYSLIAGPESLMVVRVPSKRAKGL